MPEDYWKFKKSPEGAPIRDPKELELFSINQDWNEALVKETIQNSLDAKLQNSEELIVTFSIVDVPVNGYLESLKDHAKASFDSNFNVNRRALIIEDFNTIGLDGNYHWDPSSKENKNYFNFWFREGISDKKDNNRGRWGLGKIVFHAASTLRTFFGLTIRPDQKMLLLGKAILKPHSINGDHFDYYAYYAINEKSSPIENTDDVSRFINTFKLQRNRAESGLSVIIPSIKEEIQSINIVRAVLTHYFYPIMQGTLSVIVRDDGNEIKINKETINTIANKVLKDNEKEIFSRTFTFFNDIISRSNISLYLMNADDNNELDEEVLKKFATDFRDKYNNFELVGIRLNLSIHPRGGRDKETYVKIYFKKLSNYKKTIEYFFRSGLKIEPRSKNKFPVIAALIAEEETIAKFLGDAENPAHTDWNERNERIRTNYDHHGKALRLIKNCIYILLNELEERQDVERDITFLNDIFSRVKEGPRHVQPTSEPPPPDIDGHEANPNLFNIRLIDNNTTVSINMNNIDGIEYPLPLRISFAYDTMNGNPFNKWSKFDFVVGNDILFRGIGIEPRTIAKSRGNEIYCEAIHPQASLKASGFDNNRDIKVKIEIITNEEEDQ